MVNTENWVPDVERSHCVQCGILFTLLRRKHHCRKCGDIFCATCASRSKVILSVSKFAVRICDLCFVEPNRLLNRGTEDYNDNTTLVSFAPSKLSSESSKLSSEPSKLINSSQNLDENGNRYQKLLKKIIPNLLMRLQSDKDWSLVGETNGMKTYQPKFTPDENFACAKGTCIFECPPQLIWASITDFSKNRNNFDKSFDGSKLIEQIDEATHVRHILSKPIWPAYGRDVCLLINSRMLDNDDTRMQPLLSLGVSIEHNDCPLSEDTKVPVCGDSGASNYVRCVCGPGAWLLTPIRSNNDTKIHTKASLIINVNPGGSLPTRIVRAAITSQLSVMLNLKELLSKGKFMQQFQSTTWPPMPLYNLENKKKLEGGTTRQIRKSLGKKFYEKCDVDSSSSLLGDTPLPQNEIDSYNKQVVVTSCAENEKIICDDACQLDTTANIQNSRETIAKQWNNFYFDNFLENVSLINVLDTVSNAKPYYAACFVIILPLLYYAFAVYQIISIQIAFLCISFGLFWKHSVAIPCGTTHCQMSGKLNKH